MKPPTLRDQTQRSLLWASSEAVARTLLQTLVLVVLAKLLTPADYGVVGAALIIVGISAIFSQLGVGPAIVQRPELEPRHLDAAFALSSILGFFTAGILYVSAPLFAQFFKMPALTPVLQVLAVIFPITGLAVVSESLLQRDLRFDLIARAEVASYFFGFGIVATGLAWRGWGAWALVAGQIAQMLVRTVLLFSAQPWRPRFACEMAAVRDLRRFSGGVTLARLANYLATSGDNVVVGRYLGESALGTYGRAYQLMAQPANLVGNVLEKVLFPAMARVQDQRERLASVYRQGAGMLATAMLPGSAMIYLLAPEIVHVLLGARWDGVVFPLQIFSVALLFRTSMKLSNSLIRSQGAVAQLAWCQGIYAAATIGFAYAGSARGIEGVCVGVLGSILLCFLIGAGMSLRLLGITWGQFLRDHVPGLILAALVAGVGWSSVTVLHRAHATAFWVLAGGAGAMSATMVACALLAPKFFLGPDGSRFVEQLRRRRVAGEKKEVVAPATINRSGQVSVPRITSAVFIGGCARSGTTLLGAMLGAHPDCICVPESQFKAQLLKDPRFGTPESIHRMLTNHWRFKLWELPLSAGELPLDGDDADRPARSLLRLVELYAQKSAKPEATVWIDHTPHNVRQASLLGRAFPDSKFIHIVRDGRGVAASVIPLDWGPNSIIEAARFWVEQTAYGLAAEQSFGPGRILRVTYEDLVMEPDQVMRRIAAFAGLEFTPAMTEGGGFVVPRYTAQQHALIASRPDPTRIDGWRKKLTLREQEIFEHLTEDFLGYMGYERYCAYPTRAPSWLEKSGAKVHEFARKHLFNSVRAARRRVNPVRLMLPFAPFASAASTFCNL